MKTIQYDQLLIETDFAHLIVIDFKEIWLPKSQVVHYPLKKQMDIPEWLYIEKGLHGKAIEI